MPKIAMLVSNRHDPDPRVQKEAEALTKTKINNNDYEKLEKKVFKVNKDK